VRFRALSVAVRELVEAIEWYVARSPEAAAALADEYDRAVEQIKSHPRRHARAEFIHSPRDIRQFLMRKFPYVVYYEIAGDEVVVLAVSHAAREPGYWLEGRT